MSDSDSDADPDLEPEPPHAMCNPAAFAVDTSVVIALMADRQIRAAIERGDFDNLPGAGQSLDLPHHHDPDRWLKSLIKREGLVLLPSSILLRREDAVLDEKLDRLRDETLVRREVQEFNERVIRARYDLSGGPPLITMPRDVEQTVARWAERRAARADAARRVAEERARAIEEANRRKRLERHRRWSRWLGGTGGTADCHEDR